MASSGCRIRADRLLLAALLLATAGCATPPSEPATVATPAGSGQADSIGQADGGLSGEPAPARPDPGVELPAGPARAILVSACLDCHDLGGLDLFRSFYTREDWHALVLTMQAHGAAIDADDIEILADYLGLHFSPGARPEAQVGGD